MSEQVDKVILFQQCMYFCGGMKHVEVTDWHYSENEFYVYVELRKYDDRDIILEVDTENSHKKDTLSRSTQDFLAIRIAIEEFDDQAKRIKAIAEDRTGEVTS